MSHAKPSALAAPALAVVASAALFAACADSGGPIIQPTGRIPSVLVLNDSQYTLRELHIHATEGYAGTPNVLRAPMRVGEELVYYGDGATFFTVFREKVAAGPIIALTTERPVSLARDAAYQLTIYDEAFRITEGPYIDPDGTLLPIVGDPGTDRDPPISGKDAGFGAPDGGLGAPDGSGVEVDAGAAADGG